MVLITLNWTISHEHVLEPFSFITTRLSSCKRPFLNLNGSLPTYLIHKENKSILNDFYIFVILRVEKLLSKISFVDHCVFLLNKKVWVPSPVFFSKAYSCKQQRKHQISTSLALCEGTPPWRTSNTESVFMSWRHHGICYMQTPYNIIFGISPHLALHIDHWNSSDVIHLPRIIYSAELISFRITGLVGGQLSQGLSCRGQRIGLPRQCWQGVA